MYPSETLVLVKRKRHKALADQITTVSKKRITNGYGKLNTAHPHLSKSLYLGVSNLEISRLPPQKHRPLSIQLLEKWILKIIDKVNRLASRFHFRAELFVDVGKFVE